MFKPRKALLTIAIACLLTTSCKLDNVPPIASRNTNDDDTVLGINVIGKKIYDSYLTSAWRVSATIIEYYDENYVVVSGTYTSNLFSGVNLNDNVQSVDFVNHLGNTQLTSSSGGEYQLFTTDNVLFMTLPADVFGRSKNTPIRITRLNAGSMVWVALDEQADIVDGKKLYKAHRVIFYK